ncbi:hypothetical protein BKA65DRAFT_471728 [Rhexocercosporidium sp. MPI-PUGE-AT-0058]|nr:hypothetical protein BKA65DRAFT_471728 [Rhexocercosporidium sp. MPI-PUGE-AT-0058]
MARGWLGLGWLGLGLEPSGPQVQGATTPQQPVGSNQVLLGLLLPTTTTYYLLLLLLTTYYYYLLPTTTTTTTSRMSRCLQGKRRQGGQARPGQDNILVEPTRPGLDCHSLEMRGEGERREGKGMEGMGRMLGVCRVIPQGGEEGGRRGEKRRGEKRKQRSR